MYIMFDFTPQKEQYNSFYYFIMAKIGTYLLLFSSILATKVRAN